MEPHQKEGEVCGEDDRDHATDRALVEGPDGDELDRSGGERER